eukprot:COSAG04_NODE_14107_length_580_cov_1.070686_1_plen_141_part_01
MLVARLLSVVVLDMMLRAAGQSTNCDDFCGEGRPCNPTCEGWGCPNCEGEGSFCDVALLAEACAATRSDAFACAECAGDHQQALSAAGCGNDAIAGWCAGMPPAPAPPTPSSSAGGPSIAPTKVGKHPATVTIAPAHFHDF